MERVAVIAFGFLFIVVPATLAVAGLRRGSITVGGWGTFERASMPVRFWMGMVFHAAVIGMGVVLVVRACST